MLKRITLFSLLVVLVLALGITVVSAQDSGSPVLDSILARGELICGVNNTLDGFGKVNDAGEFVGFDTDFCRALAAAVLGDANAVTFRPLTAGERPTALGSGEIDVLIRNTTWTLSRDTEWGATFGPTTFYDGQGVMAFADSGAATLEDLEGGTICTNAGTTTELNISDAMGQRGLDFDLQTFQDFDLVMEALAGGRCDAVTTDKSGLISRKAVFPDPGALQIFDITLSKEPLGPVSPQSDPIFADIIRWTVWGMITAEEAGITSDNIDDFLGSDDTNVSRLLGLGENPSGSYLGLENNSFMVEVIRQVGNYGEVFERNLGADTIFGLGRGVNGLWTDGGLLYAPPFR